jgi:ABC-type Fe3+-hydroxamate transport system substrate-binding protein
VGNLTKYVDQLGNEVFIPVKPTRIVSLVPSQTELLADLGLENQVVGITKFCVHPLSWRNQKAIIGGTKKFDIQSIKALNPDLIIGNKEENYQEGIEALKNIAPVWMSDIATIEDAMRMILELGTITGRKEMAELLTGTIQNSFNSIARVKSRTVLYLIWYNPWMAAGCNTFINTMINQAGLKNCLESTPRYPEINLEEIKALNPDFIFLSSEPFPFKGKHREVLQQNLPFTKIILVDGEMFSWYGSRLRLFADYFNNLIKPSLQ